MAVVEHQYRTELRWHGSTSLGYKHYPRAHSLVAAPAECELSLTADPAFLGDPSLLNPEQLLVAAASSCQLLSFLAVAAAARLDVVGYRDTTTAVMPEGDTPWRITRIDIRPTITLDDTDRPRPDTERLLHLVVVAHQQCFIANSLNSDVVVDAEFVWRNHE